MGFTPLSYLEDAVKNKSTKDIRRSLRSYIKKCLGDTQEIMDAVNYVKKSLSKEEYDSIWEEYDGLNLEIDKSKWDKDYFALIQGDLRYNFSKERFDHTLEVGRYVYGTTKTIKSTVNKNTSTSTNTKDKEKNFLPLILVGGFILLLGIPMVIKMMKK